MLISIGWLALCWPSYPDKKRPSHVKAVVVLVGLVAVLWAAVAPAASEAGRLRSGPLEAEQLQQLQLETRYGTLLCPSASHYRPARPTRTSGRCARRLVADA